MAIGVKQDISKEDDWKKVINQVVEKFGKINILINNAAISGQDATFETSSAEEWNKIMNVNSTGTFLGIKAVIPEMEKADGGSIINISSVVANIAGTMVGGLSYSTSKGAIRTLTKAAAVRVGKSNIRVNTIQPGAILTPMAEEFLNEEQLKQMSAVSVFNRMGIPEDVAKASLFLASNDSQFITGTEIVVDGGWLINEDR